MSLDEPISDDFRVRTEQHPSEALHPPLRDAEANGVQASESFPPDPLRVLMPGKDAARPRPARKFGPILGWMRRVGRAWQSVHERIALEQLPLTPLVAAAGKHSSTEDPEQSIRVIPVRSNGSEVQYGILAPAYSRLSFRLRLGERPRFSAGIDVLEGDSPITGITEFVVGVQVNGTVHEVAARSRKNASFERRRRISADLAPYSGQEITLILRTRAQDAKDQGKVPAVWGNPRLTSRRSLSGRISQLRKDIRKLGVVGVAETFTAAMRGQLALNDSHALYQLWVEKHKLNAADVDRIRTSIAAFERRPLISIVTPVYNTDARWLEKCIESVRRQLYPEWELCLADDASTRPHVRRILERYAKMDPRIRVVHLPVNQGIALASNEALRLASGEFVGLLDHDDELTQDALYEVVSLLLAQPEADVVYSDEDKLEADGTRTEPFFKPDWSPEYLLSCMYTCHFTVYRTELVNKVGGFRQGFEGSQDYDLMLRVTEETDRVFHVPRILYHWRRAEGSAADSRAAKPYAYAAGKRALADRFRRRGEDVLLSNGKLYGFYRVQYAVDANARVSIVIPTRDRVDMLRSCVESIEARTVYPNYEILIVDNGSTDPPTEEYLARLTHPVVRDARPFNFSRLNNFAARRATGDYLVFLNNDTEVITPEWLTAMLEFCQRPDIGVVGAKLLFPDGRIQHAGITLGLGGVAGHVLTGFPGGSSHYFGIGNVVRNVAAVTGACMMVSRQVFESIGGFDEELPVAYNDVDFCLRARQLGLRIVWTPYAELYHHQSASRGAAIDPGEIGLMRSRWGSALLADPYYNPNLTLEHEDLRVRL